MIFVKCAGAGDVPGVDQAGSGSGVWKWLGHVLAVPQHSEEQRQGAALSWVSLQTARKAHFCPYFCHCAHTQLWGVWQGTSCSCPCSRAVQSQRKGLGVEPEKGTQFHR